MARPSADSSAKESPMPVELGAAPASSSDEGDWSDWSPSEHSTEDDGPNDEGSFNMVQSHEWSEQIDERPAFLAKTHTNRQVGHRSEHSRTPSHDGSSVAASVSGDDHMSLSFPDPLHANNEAFIVFDTPSEGSNASLVGQDSDGDGEAEHAGPGKTTHQHSEVEYSFLLDAKEDTSSNREVESLTVDSDPPVPVATKQVDVPLASEASLSSPSSGPSSGCTVAQWVQSTVQASQTPSPSTLDQDNPSTPVFADPLTARISAADHTKLARTTPVEADSLGDVKDEDILVDAEDSPSKHELVLTVNPDRHRSTESPSDSQASLRSVDSNLTILANSPSSRVTSPAVFGSPVGLRKRSTQQASSHCSGKEPSTSQASSVPSSSSLAVAVGEQANARVPQGTQTNKSETQSSPECADIEYLDLARTWVCGDTSNIQVAIPNVLCVVAAFSVLWAYIWFLFFSVPAPSPYAVPDGNLAAMDKRVVSDSSSPSTSANEGSRRPSEGHGQVGSQLESTLSIAPAILEQVGVASPPIAPVQHAADDDRATTTKGPARRPSSRQSNASSYRMVRPFNGQVEGVLPRSEDSRHERCHCQCSKGHQQSATDDEDLWAQPSDTDLLAAFKALVEAAQAQARTFAKHASHTTLRESKKRIKRLSKEANHHAQKLGSDFDYMAREAADLNAYARRQSVKMSKSLHHLFHRTGKRTEQGRAQNMVKLEQRVKQAMELFPDRSEQLRREGKKAAEVVTRRLLEAKWMVESWRNGEIDLFSFREAGFKVKNCDTYGVKDVKKCKARRKMAKERGRKVKPPRRKRGGWA